MGDARDGWEHYDLKLHDDLKLEHDPKRRLALAWKIDDIRKRMWPLHIAT